MMKLMVDRETGKVVLSASFRELKHLLGAGASRYAQMANTANRRGEDALCRELDAEALWCKKIASDVDEARDRVLSEKVSV